MQTNNSNTSITFKNSWSRNKKYFDMLCLIASLSRLFSERSIPHIDYRIAENLFCKFYNAINKARACMAYDATIGQLGIGIKTFGIPGQTSLEKIAEFNKLKPELDKFSGKDLAIQLAMYRNDRIDFADTTYNVKQSIYHIIGRKQEKLVVFNTPYNKIDIQKIQDVRDTVQSISFNDGTDHYNFNKSKSVLLKRFDLPYNEADIVKLDVNILDDPYDLLYQLLEPNVVQTKESPFEISFSHQKTGGDDYVILPLYSLRGSEPYVPPKSGLNQWNAAGRVRDENEVYIPIPIKIHRNFPTFFPDRNTPFELQLPDGEILSAKVCQSEGKALMSNPNSALGKWILRKVLRKNPGELVTMTDLLKFGIDSILVEDLHSINQDGLKQYKIIFSDSTYESYEDFIEKHDNM